MTLHHSITIHSTREAFPPSHREFIRMSQCHQFEQSIHESTGVLLHQSQSLIIAEVFGNHHTPSREFLTLLSLPFLAATA